MSAIAEKETLIQASASTYAFRAGQLVEELLIKRATERAREEKSPAVTAEQVASVLDELLIKDIRERLEERNDNEPTQRERRKVA
ncbi:MAG: hypothetical protein H8E44_43800 [Planctomycetes bacterium]|nr:hypothetical protein [Planctomycetota bacterium]MBL7041216.1 hypothetical protein [Pirellulaceae bacterium]